MNHTPLHHTARPQAGPCGGSVSHRGGRGSAGHVPVLAGEAVSLLGVRPGGLWVDATLGAGGHAAMILEKSAPAGVLFGLDRDEEAVEYCRNRLSGYGARFRAFHANYADAGSIMEREGMGRADGVIADLGVSTRQLDDAGRGFSFTSPGPVDMRMDRSSGPTAMDLLRNTDERDLAAMIAGYGGERSAARVAREIKRALDEGRITDTAALGAVVASAAWRRGRIHPATRTFQALRMAVNREQDSLAAFLELLPTVLKPGGRAVCISFHSLEDRAVKAAFKELSSGCICPSDFPSCVCGRTPRATVLTSGAILPSAAEVGENPRARSARLRAVEIN